MEKRKVSIAEVREETTRQTLTEVVEYMQSKESQLPYKELWEGMKEDFIRIVNGEEEAPEEEGEDVEVEEPLPPLPPPFPMQQSQQARKQTPPPPPPLRGEVQRRSPPLQKRPEKTQDELDDDYKSLLEE